MFGFDPAAYFEQEIVVAERLARHQAGQRLGYSQTTPETLAEAVAGLIGREPTWPAIRADGASGPRD